MTTELAVPGNWSIVASDKAAGTETLAGAKDKIAVAPISLVVAYGDAN